MEEANEFKKIQNISPAVFWTSNLFFDMFIHIVVCVLVLITCIICDRGNAFSGKDYGI